MLRCQQSLHASQVTFGSLRRGGKPLMEIMQGIGRRAALRIGFGWHLPLRPESRSLHLPDRRDPLSREQPPARHVFMSPRQMQNRPAARPGSGAGAPPTSHDARRSCPFAHVPILSGDVPGMSAFDPSRTFNPTTSCVRSSSIQRIPREARPALWRQELGPPHPVH